MKSFKDNLFRPGWKYLAEDYRAFADGPLAVRLDRFGCLDAVRLLEVVEFQGHFYPERHATDFVSRNGSFQDRPFGGPSIWFGTRLQDDGFRLCDASYPTIYPNAYAGRGFQMVLRHESFSIKFRVVAHGRAEVMMDPVRYRHQSGEQPSNLNQCAAWHESWLTAEQRGPDFSPEWPFPNRNVYITRCEPEFIEDENALLFRIEREFVVGHIPLFVAVTSRRPLEYGVRQERWVLQEKTSGGWACLGFGFGHTAVEALKAARQAIVTHSARLAAIGSADRFPNACLVKLSGLPTASLFAKLFPHYQTAAVIRETEDKLAFRAAQEKYGFFPMWDHIYPPRDFLLFGEPKKAEKAFRFLLDYPHVDTSMMIPIQLLPAINEMLAFLPDSTLVSQHLDFMRRFFHFTRQWCDAETGLVANLLCLAVDFPSHAGLDGLFYEAGMNSMWYNACRVLENFAMENGDMELANSAGEIAAKIEISFPKVFFDKQEGFLRTAMRQDGSYPKHELFLYTNTWGLDYIHGLHLFRKLFRPLADYQVRKLHHPMGHIFMPIENGISGRSSVSEHMNQHLGHECLCARLGGQMAEVRHVLSGYLEIFDRYRNAVETFNYGYCAGDQTQRADWQTFSATAAMQACVHAVTGLHWHRGGLFFLPADDSGTCQLRNFHFRNSQIDFEVSGKGAFVSSMQLNGIDLEGTVQIPDDCLNEGHVIWRVRRTSVPPTHPVLLYALDAPVSRLRSDSKLLTFQVNKTVHASICIYSPDDILVSVNGKNIPVERLPEKRFTFDYMFHRGSFVEIKLVARR